MACKGFEFGSFSRDSRSSRKFPGSIGIGRMNIDPPAAPHFDPAFRARLCDLFQWRRDVRRFHTDPLPSGLLERLIEVACQAPSVGLCQPWRFVVVDDLGRRQRVVENFESCNRDALAEYAGDRSTRYAALKLAGLREAPCHLAVFADRSTGVGHGLGRRTMPEMADYSVVTAVFSIWLAARAEGIGMGWVSILDPLAVTEILDVPKDWRLIGYFCLGYPQADDDRPELARVGWEERRPAGDFIFRR
jgi:5,6-dimethylbenzimidazole synthase